MMDVKMILRRNRLVAWALSLLLLAQCFSTPGLASAEEAPTFSSSKLASDNSADLDFNGATNAPDITATDSVPTEESIPVTTEIVSQAQETGNAKAPRPLPEPGTDLDLGLIDMASELVLQDGFVFDPATGTILSYAEPEGEEDIVLTIPNQIANTDVVAIGQSAFADCSAITSVTIAEGILTIGDAAFEGCSNIASIICADSITNIGASAFRNCTSLTSIHLPENLEEIESFTFLGCSKLATIQIPASVSFVGNRAFDYCVLLNSVAFASSSQCTGIGDNAFSNCFSLTSISLPTQVQSIGTYAFASCRNLQQIVIPEKVKEVKNGTFSGCTYLSSAYLSNQIQTISDTAFSNCPNVRIFTRKPSTASIYADTMDLPCVDLPSSITIDPYPTYTTQNDITVTASAENATLLENTHVFESNGSFTFTAKDSYGNIVTETVTIQNIDRRFIFNAQTGEITGLSVTGLSGNLEIPDSFDQVPVTAIGAGVFQNTAVTTVVIPENVTQIGQSAFRNCASLTQVELPATLTQIGDSAFYGCSKLGSIEIPDAVLQIGPNAFNYCVALTGLSFGEDSLLTSIGDFAFGNNMNLSAVELPQNLTSIGEFAFASCKKLTSITIPDRVTSLGASAFKNCTALTSAVLSARLASIPNNCFYGCSSLQQITIPGSVNSIGSGAFDACGQFTINGDRNSYAQTYASQHNIPFAEVVPQIVIEQYNTDPTNQDITVTAIGKNCTLETATHTFTQNGSYTFTAVDADGNTLTQTVTITNIDKTPPVITVDPYFTGLTNQNITVTVHTNEGTLNADSHTFTENGTFLFVATDAVGNQSTRSITITNIDKRFEIDDQGNLTAYHGSEAEITIPEMLNGIQIRSIGNGVFSNQSNLTQVSLPNGLEYIGNSAFEDCTLLSQITIPNTVTSIGDSAFSGCVSLVTFTLPNSVAQIGSSAFRNCTSLQSITLSSALTELPDSLFFGCIRLNNVALPASLELIGDHAFNYCVALQSITFAENSSLSGLGVHAFANCKSLTELALPQSLTHISAFAFVSCSNLEQITLPSNLNHLGGYAFKNCSALESIDLPDSLDNIETGTFSYCSSLTEIEIPGNIYTVGSNAFAYCEALASVTICDGVVNLKERAFYQCTALDTLSLGGDEARLKYIGYRAFDGTALVSVTVPDTVNKVESYAFATPSLQTVTLLGFIWSVEEWAFGSLQPEFPVPDLMYGSSSFVELVPMGVGTTPDSYLDVGALRWYRFVPMSSGRYIFGTTGDSDTSGRLYENTTLLMTDDDSGDGQNFNISCVLEAGKGYYACVGVHNPDATSGSHYGGYYSFYIYKVDVTESTPLTLDVPLSGTLTEDETWYSFTPSVTGGYRFYTSGNLDTIGEVYGTTGFIASDDDSGDGENFVVSCNLIAGQEYNLKVLGYNKNTTGAFTITVSYGKMIQTDTPVYENLSTSDDQWYVFTPSTSGWYRFFSSNVNVSSTTIELYEGNTLLASDNTIRFRNIFSLGYNLNAGTMYRIRVKFAEGLTASHIDYTFNVKAYRQATANGIVIYGGDLALGTEEWYYYTPNQTGECLIISNSNVEFFTELYDGNTMINDGSDSEKSHNIVQTLTAGKTYFIKVYGYTTGGYYLHLEQVGAELPLNLYEPVSDYLSSNQERWYRFKPAADGMHRFYMTGSLKSELRIYSSHGSLVKSAYRSEDIENSNFANLSVECNLLAAEEYIIKVSPYSSSYGNFSLKVFDYQAWDDNEEPLSITIAPGKEYWFKFTATRDATYWFYPHGNAEIFSYLFDPSMISETNLMNQQFLYSVDANYADIYFLNIKNRSTTDSYSLSLYAKPMMALDGEFSLKNQGTRKYLTLDNTVSVRSYASSYGTNGSSYEASKQVWTLSPSVEGKDYYIIHRFDEVRYLQNTGVANASPAMVNQADLNWNNREPFAFRFLKNEDGSYRILDGNANSNLALTVAADGSSVVFSPYTGSSNQRWNPERIAVTLAGMKDEYEEPEEDEESEEDEEPVTEVYHFFEWVDSNLINSGKSLGCFQVNTVSEATPFDLVFAIANSYYFTIWTHGNPRLILTHSTNALDYDPNDLSTGYGYLNTSILEALPDDYFVGTKCVTLISCSTAGDNGEDDNFATALHKKGVENVVGFEKVIYGGAPYSGAALWGREFLNKLAKSGSLIDAASHAIGVIEGEEYESFFDEENNAWVGPLRNLDSCNIKGNQNQVIRRSN